MTPISWIQIATPTLAGSNSWIADDIAIFPPRHQPVF
jgi:hypothetical protein